ncbi:MAG: solute-binding protein [Candidatus Aminicenantes bacterium]|uniref:ABC-type tungstate transport system, periplasmic binding protein n=1 Tax=Candidatus Saccharicenans subterraneus TaxID=2508984 RepID=A0A3E2BL10_9BACT|nr:solute-binding protein [Candidatus Aminicenantes bacterium]RFT15296.1 MAG: ABC-type tungstate transport system, periplasmic binding protein [Candidatus Saccharicenans subterraneum]
MTGNRSQGNSEARSPEKRAFYFLLVVLVLFLAWTAVSRLKPGRDNQAGSVIESSPKLDGFKPEIVLATTTSLYDSGLLEALVPLFEKKSGFRVKVLAVGTGEALALGRRQAADLLLVHAPEPERKFMEEGYGQSRKEFMTGDFVLAGPSSDAAQIRGLGFVEAFSRIASGHFPFVSRADNSGTHDLEMKIWAEAGIRPSGRWYLETGQGMAESLRIASEKQAYILTDYPTFYRLGPRLNLKVLGRDEKYKNVYSAIVVKNKSGQVNEAGAGAFIDFLFSREAQSLIDEFDRDSRTGKPLFQALRPGNETGESE